MTEKNHSAENALAERVNGILKQEYYLDAEFETRLAAREPPFRASDYITIGGRTGRWE
jgi:hypothetical protein